MLQLNFGLSQWVQEFTTTIPFFRIESSKGLSLKMLATPDSLLGHKQYTSLALEGSSNYCLSIQGLTKYCNFGTWIEI